MEGPVIAVYDANILYPAPLRDLFIRLAQAGLVRGRWTETIHDEWVRNVLKDNPHLSSERLARTRTLMNEAVRDSVINGYEDLIDSLTLPDPDDRHVLAAAIHGDAEVIVTFNLKDFPAATLDHFGIEAQHPDAFLETSRWRRPSRSHAPRGNAVLDALRRGQSFGKTIEMASRRGLTAHRWRYGLPSASDSPRRRASKTAFPRGAWERDGSRWSSSARSLD